MMNEAIGWIIVMALIGVLVECVRICLNGREDDD